MSRRFLLVPLLILGVLTAACDRQAGTTASRVSGHVEATEVQVSADVAGRILELRVNEGDRVNVGDVIARLDTRDTELQIRRARADREAAAAQLRLLRAGSRAEDVRQADAQVQASEADIAALEADLRAAELDLERFESLLQANAGSRKQRDDAQARVDVARERLRGARDRAAATRETSARLRSGSRPEEIDVAQARVGAADAQIATLQKAVDDARVVSPVSGIVTQKLAEAGELVLPRAPLLVVTDLDHAWANVFVPEPLVPKVRLGQSATVYTDAGGSGLDGKVTYVSPKAEFTPRNVQTADERSKLVYRIKVTVDNREGILKPGMPVDAELSLQ
jgi:HlyD family secretion protein